MSEEQGQQKKKGWGFLLLFFVILLIAGYCVWFANSGLPPDMRGPVWDEAHDDIKNAVTGYATYHNGSLPTLNGIYSNANCSDCSVINISALLHTNDGMLYDYPDSLHLSASGNDNCGGNASLGCRNDSSYIWIVDTYGNVYSYCAGAGCITNNSGYQDVWP
jgi:hypothetical protein